MTLQHTDQLYKVVNVGYSRSNTVGTGLRSALLKNSPHTINYQAASPNGQISNIFVAPRTNGTPILLYGDLENARGFAAGDNRRVIYRAEIFGEVMTPPRVLKLNLGWSQHAVAFWEAILKGEEYTEWPTRTAPPGTLAVFGVMRLLEQVR